MPNDPHASIQHTCRIRCYEELNDFLPPEKRKVRFEHVFSGNPAIKDQLEAIGVPHTEIDLILVNGKSVGFDYRLCANDDVAVYPVFESLDIAQLQHLRPKPLREIRFIVDANLGILVGKLRLLGFDTLYQKDFDDHQIVELSVKEKRIILTRDKGIFKYARVTHGYWVRSDNPKIQIEEVVDRLQLREHFNPLTRCFKCNGLVFAVDKSVVESRLGAELLQSQKQFYQCRNCQHIYWHGSHYQKILNWIAKLKKV